jgi:hypothetical protein
MNSTLTLKVKFESNDKIYDFKLADSDIHTFFEQQEKFLSSIGYEKDKKIYSLYNQQSFKFFINVGDVRSSLNLNLTYTFKNCNEYSKKIVQDMYKYLNAYKDNVRRVSALNNPIPSSMANELKTVVFGLQNYFQVDAFTEEFIAFDGIAKLIEILEISTGHTKVYIL